MFYNWKNILFFFFWKELNSFLEQSSETCLFWQSHVPHEMVKMTGNDLNSSTLETTICYQLSSNERAITSFFIVEWFISCHSWLWLRQLQLFHKSSSHLYKVVHMRPFPFLVSCGRRQWKVRLAYAEPKLLRLYTTMVFVIDPNESRSMIEKNICN